MSKEIKKSDVYRKYIFDELRRNIDISDNEQKIKELENYVDSLDSHQSKELCRHLSHSRKNQVFRFVSSGPERWTVKTVSISKIYMGGINKKINQYFIRNAWLLKNIAKDKGIRKHREFKKWGNIHPRSLSLIADKTGSLYRIVDGNHRAVRLACSGQREFELIFYKR